MNAANSNQAETGRRRRIFTRIGVAILSIIGSAVIVYFITLVFGSVSGNEFAPDTFSRREFSYYQLPLVGRQVSAVRRVEKKSDLCQHLIDNGYITALSTASRWDLVAARCGTRQLRDGDALILCHYLDARDTDGELYWLDWTKDHPKLAKLLWPKVAEAARAECYTVIPEMFRAAWSHEDVVTLQRELDSIFTNREDPRNDQIPAERPLENSSENKSHSEA